MEFNIRPTFKAIRLFERMTSTSFLDIDRNQNLMFHLLYCCLLAHPENNFYMTFETACTEFFPKYAEGLVESFALEMEILNQFEAVSSSDDSSLNQQEKSSPNKEENMFLSSLIPLLIIDCHLDPDFVLNEMDYTDTELYLKSSVDHYRQAQEDKRFWTYLTVAPHISSKSGIKNADDLIEFSWEKDKKKEEAKKNIKRDRQKLIDIGLLQPDENETKKE